MNLSTENPWWGSTPHLPVDVQTYLCSSSCALQLYLYVASVFSISHGCLSGLTNFTTIFRPRGRQELGQDRVFF